ncbi:MAG TPA: response regulator, partial [Candidatus Methylacidiphilales bacterium]|nr:response regulator [Candidatus Methylacidiphilales bacterium]
DYDARMACTSRVHGCRSAEIVVEPLKPLAGLGKRPVKNPVLLHLRKYAVPYLLVPSVVMLILAVAMVTANGGLSAPSLVSLQVAIASALAALYASGFSVAALLARLALPARFIHKPQLVSALVAAKAKEPVTASARMAARLKCVSTVSLGVPTIMTTMTAQPVPVRADQWVFPDHLMPQRRAASTCSVARIAASQENASPSVVNGGTTVLPKVTPNEQLKQLVLIADDDAAIRHVMRIHMEMNGFRVIEAASGSQVLTELDNKPDLILLDLMMPGGLNGEECLREIQKRSPGVRVIVVSGRIDVEESKSEINAFEFIAKPVDFSTLITAVNRAFHRPTAATV